MTRSESSQEATAKGVWHLGNTQHMIVTEFTEAKGFSGFQPPSFDDTYQENKYHSQYKSCINKNSPTHKEPSLYQLPEPDVFNNTTKDLTRQTSSSVICSPSSLNVTIFQLATLCWMSRLLPSLWIFSLYWHNTWLSRHGELVPSHKHFLQTTEVETLLGNVHGL